MSRNSFIAFLPRRPGNYRPWCREGKVDFVFHFTSDVVQRCPTLSKTLSRRCPVRCPDVVRPGPGVKKSCKNTAILELAGIFRIPEIPMEHHKGMLQSPYSIRGCPMIFFKPSTWMGKLVEFYLYVCFCIWPPPPLDNVTLSGRSSLHWSSFPLNIVITLTEKSTKQF
jgi:hypothetical protein